MCKEWGEKRWIPQLCGVWAELCKQSCFSCGVIYRLARESLSDRFKWVNFSDFHSLSSPLFPLQLLHVITGNLRLSHLQKGTMESNSKDIHFSLLSCLFWRGWKGVVGLFLAAPPSSARITQRRHPEHSSALTQHRQDLATPQQLLRAFLAFKLLLMIMGDIHSNQSKHGLFGFLLEALKKKCKWLFF